GPVGLARAAATASSPPALLRLGLPLLSRPLGRARRSPLLGPGITMAKHRHVRVPAGDRDEGQRRARAVTGRHVACPVRTDEWQLHLAGGAPLPGRPLSAHPDPPPAAMRPRPARGSGDGDGAASVPSAQAPPPAAER